MHFWRENAGELKITESTLFWQSHAYNQLLNLLHTYLDTNKNVQDIGCKIEDTHKYIAFKYIGDKVRLLHTISSSLMYVRGIF